MGIFNIYRNVINFSMLIVTITASLITEVDKSVAPEKPQEEVRTLTEKEKFFKPVLDKLYTHGVDSSFVKYLLDSEEAVFNTRFVKIDVPRGSGKGGGYSTKYRSHYNNYSVAKSAAFLEDNYEVLNEAELKYDVPKEVITSILWIETRHGGYLGNHNIASVFLSTAMATQPEYLEMNKKRLKQNFRGTKKELNRLIEKLEARSEKKANWAFDQLLALEKMHCDLEMAVCDIEGSWAGAFGMSQFLPSSYISWAVDGDEDGEINLFNKEDAIHSVANYLKTNGWGPTKQNKRDAVFHYNNSTAYVNAVLTLANKLESKARALDSSRR